MTQITQGSTFIDELKESIETFFKSEHITLEEQRIIVTIDSNGIKTKIVVPLPKKQKQRRQPTELAQKLQEAKKIFKGRQDLVYICTLLLSLNNELKKFDISQLSEEGKNMLLPAIGKINSNLTSIIKGVENK